MDAQALSTLILAAVLAGGAILNRISASGRRVHRDLAEARAVIVDQMRDRHALCLQLAEVGIEPVPEPASVAAYRKSIEAEQ